MSTEKELRRHSKFLSLVLRHRPELIGIELDEQGWTGVATLIERARAAGVPLDLDTLRHLVATNDKQRFAFDAAGDRIRASQGHSVAVGLGYAPEAPPEVLYHGTAGSAVASILANGLEKRGRHHVHLSPDAETARRVGRRHGPPVIFTVPAGRMHRDGHLFFRSDNGVWLTDHVPAAYLE